MNRLLQNRLALQLLFTSVAAVSVLTLSILLVSEAIRSAESVVLGEAYRSLRTAVHELQQQYQYRVSSDTSWSVLPPSAHDLSLRGITQTVLRSYPSVEGGFYSNDDFLGYAYPTHDTGDAKTDMPYAEKGLITAAVKQALKTHGPVERIVRGKTDLLVIEAASDKGQTAAAWAMKRLAGRTGASAYNRDILLGILVAGALVSIAGSLMTGVSLARGVAQIKSGLAKLQSNFEFRLPERTDELGGISRSVNQMAYVRTRLEAELRREERLRALGRLTAGLAHEIRNPLNSIRLTVQLLEHRLQSNSIRAEDLKVVRNEVDRLNSLLNDLLDLQRTRQPHPQLQPVLPVVEHCLHLVEHQAAMQGTELRFNRPADSIDAIFDAQQLNQAIVNLLLNALEATEGGGAVNIQIAQEGSVATVEVQNEGISLSSEQQEHLFEPFYTTKPSGTGLGLAVSRELMRSQGGELRYDPSKPGVCFVVELVRT